MHRCAVAARLASLLSLIAKVTFCQETKVLYETSLLGASSPLCAASFAWTSHLCTVTLALATVRARHILEL